jgi:nitric oxide dioxygenase
MTPEQVTLVATSYAALGADAATMADGFYRRLFEADPSARDLFDTAPGQMSAKFALELAALVEGISSFRDFAARAVELGGRHAVYGVRAPDYAAAREALISSLAEAFGRRWNDELAAAWRGAYDLTAELMMAGGAGATDSPGEASATAR